ncbi:methyltransferase domain-containing protein [Inquilinus limosus]
MVCGTGAGTRLAAAHSEAGRVVGLDFNGGMLAAARTLSNSGAPVEWVEGSASGLWHPSSPERSGSLE